MTALKVTDASKATSLSLDFLIVGGSISGLACAIALRRIGHNVVVVEKKANLDGDLSGCRLPPNLSKIFYGWGLEEELRKHFVTSDAMRLNIRETGEFIGGHVYSEELLRETRGEYLFGKMGDLRRLLYNVAVSLGAEIRLGTTVQSVQPDDGAVTLVTGEVLAGDVLIGADGDRGLCREHVMNEADEGSSIASHGGSSVKTLPSPLNMYTALVPQAEILKDTELAKLYSKDRTMLHVWFGDRHAVMGFSTGVNSDFALIAYGPNDGNGQTWDDPAPLDGLAAYTFDSESRLQKLVALAKSPICVAVEEHPPLDSWVSGKLVLIGAAAHPIPPGSLQDLAMAAEDGAVLAKLFSHLTSEDQIGSLLCAFQDVREPRCNSVQSNEVGQVHYMTMEPSEFQQWRDESMRAKRDAGINVLDSLDADVEESAEWVEMKEVFGYDAEDQADEWYVTWGLLRERARGNNAVDLSSAYSAWEVTHSQD